MRRRRWRIGKKLRKIKKEMEAKMGDKKEIENDKK